MHDPATPPSAVSVPAGPARRRRWLGTSVALLALLALAALAWYATHRTPAKAAGGAGGPAAMRGPRGAPASTVGSALAKLADLPVRLDALGTVTPIANVTVQAQVSGVLTQVAYREGQMVKKGELLAVIDPQPFQIALAQAEGARARDEAQLEAARVTLQRYQTLLDQDSIARQSVDTQAALVKQLEGTVAIDRANAATAKLNLGWSRVVAPISGRLGLRPVDAGNYIGAGSAGGVAVITQLAPIDVEFALPQDHVPEVQARTAAGARLTATAYDRTRTRQLDVGVFSTLDNLIDTQTGTIKAKARFANADGALFPNQFVNLSLLLHTIHAAVVVPVTALRHGPEGDFVYVVGADQTVALRPVTRGEATVELAAIVKGLAAGERVVTEGGDRLKDGARVQLARPASAASGGARRAAGTSGASGVAGARRDASPDSAALAPRDERRGTSAPRPNAPTSAPR